MTSAPSATSAQAPHPATAPRAGGSFDRLGGRRFSLVLLLAFTYTALLVGGYIEEGGYITLQLMTVGAYLTANGHQKHLEIKNGTAS